MKIKQMVALFFTLVLAETSPGQFLSHLNATKEDALFTTYAAPPERSRYPLDQGYQLLWNDPESGADFISGNGPGFGLAFSCNGQNRYRISELYREPVITHSYSDLVKYFFYPFPEIRSEVFFVVYNSTTALAEISMYNEGHFNREVTLFPWLCYPATDSLSQPVHQNIGDNYRFNLSKPRDGWMKEHEIPLMEKMEGYFTGNIRFDSVMTFSFSHSNVKLLKKKGLIIDLKKTFYNRNRNSRYISGLIAARTFRLQPGDRTRLRVIIHLQPAGAGHLEINPRVVDWPCIKASSDLMKLNRIDLEMLIKADERAYEKIPRLKFSGPDKEMLYWSAFSLLRQCMMPPEGRCSYNYYVFSREPKWGWGYGGQVFHESLSMAAYAYMDPEGAMNSQRVYFERQHPDGYINYRTGPYLDETIMTDGEKTTSAPWFNYENLEIYQITRDKTFLKQAYESGSRFYRYFVVHRDKDKNGLCSWGGAGELESVRDARVAVWDKVGPASNFEGPDINSMLVVEARSLEKMATILKMKQAASQWKKEADERSDLINKRLWDPQTGFYYNINKTDQRFTFKHENDLKIKEIIGFLPLWAGVANQDQIKLLVRTLTDTTEFWRRYGVPTLSAKEDYYCPIGYWNGPVWVQWEYLLYRGLQDYGYQKIADELADRVSQNMILHLKKDHVFWEFYSADDAQAGWNKTYIWAGLAVRFLL